MIVVLSLFAVKLVQIIDKRLTAWMPSTTREKKWAATAVPTTSAE